MTNLNPIPTFNLDSVLESVAKQIENGYKTITFDLEGDFLHTYGMEKACAQMVMSEVSAFESFSIDYRLETVDFKLRKKETIAEQARRTNRAIQKFWD